MTTTRLNDYSLVGTDTARAIEQGLAEATWYASPVPRQAMCQLLDRKNGPAIRDTLLWFALIIGSGVAGLLLWGSWWAIFPFAIYGVLYASTSDSRWHEAGHGTAFKTDWMNNFLYEIASFMVGRESIPWRWSHTRHHSDTIIVGRDPEIAVTRPPKLLFLFAKIFGIKAILVYYRLVLLHSIGRITPEEKTFIPESEYAKVVVRARIYLLIYAAIFALAYYTGSILPLMFVGLPPLYGGWLMFIYGHTQHAGLAENVLDHRLNSRTLYMNALNRYLYWEMNYHVEHHMFPMVPYHNLGRLHALVKADMPKPYNGLLDAWREIVPAVLRQRKDPTYYVRRELPTPTFPAGAPAAPIFTAKGRPIAGWIEIGDSRFVRKEDVIRFDHDGKTYAVYRTADGALHATDGNCTHGKAHLADGFVSGTLIECPKHNGRFDITDGSPRRPPACVALKTYQVAEHDGKVFVDLASAGGCGINESAITCRFRVVSNENVATYIKELVLEADGGSPVPDYQPGDYLQFDIPAYGEISLREIVVSAPFAEIWKAENVFDYCATNAVAVRRNFSIATHPGPNKQLRFNVRISTPPRDKDCSAGVGSAYLHRLKAGDEITAIGPFGSFHIKPTEREMVYLGGGAGMAPLRSHIAHLFETRRTGRTVSLWYGARSLQESFYRDYFEDLARRFLNFTFHLALSEPRPEDHWQSDTGFIHEVLLRNYLAHHAAPANIEYYLCGPPAMIEAAITMLTGLHVDPRQIAFDEF